MDSAPPQSSSSPYLSPADTDGINPRTYLIVTIVITTLSICGALGIVIPFLVSPSWRRLRHRLIVGLAISDFATALTILIPSCIALEGIAPENNTSCYTEGFFFLIAILGATLSTLSIAVCTYALLIYPLSRFTDIISRPWTPFFMFIAFWCIGAIVTGVGYAVYGFDRTLETLCFYGPNSGQFQNLILLLPRCIVFLIVIILYVLLFWHFRHVHNSIGVVSDFDESMPAQPPDNAFSPLDFESRRGSAVTATESTGDSSSKMFSGWNFAKSGGGLEDRKDSAVHLITPASPKSGRPSLIRLLTGSKAKVPLMKEVERDRIGLATLVAWDAKVETSDEKASIATDVSPASPLTTSMHRSPLERSLSSASVSSPIRPALVRVNSRSIGEDVIISSPRHSPPLATHAERPELTRANSSKSQKPVPWPARPTVEGGAADAIPRSLALDGHVDTPSSPAPAVMPLSHAASRSINVGPVTFSPTNLALALSRTVTRAQSPREAPLRAPPVPSAQAIVAAGDAARRRASHHGPEACEHGLMGLGAALHDDGSATMLEKLPRGRRMSAQEMNRKASIMMTLYPLSYIVLFSVSIARLGNDIAVGHSAPNSVLTVLSKWFIYASGLVDCFIFLIIEGGVRRLMRQV